jgi:hypothetical protein
MKTLTALLVLVAGGLLGIAATLVAHQEPGALLGVFIIIGSVAAVLCIQRDKAYLLFPVPALTFFVAAIVAGKVHDAKFGSSTAAFAGNAAQWIAGIFFPAVVATILVLLIGGGRWLLGRQVVTGQALLAPGGPRPPQPARRPGPGARRPARDEDPSRDSWADENPFGDQQVLKTEMIPAAGPEGPPKPGRPAWTGDAGRQRPQGPQRPPRDRDRDRGPRPERDQWGEPRSQPPGTGPRQPPPGTGPRQPPPGTGPRQPPPGTGPRPRPGGQNGAQPRAPRPSFNPNPRPPRPPRPNPPEGWNPR